MYAQVEKSKENKDKAVANFIAQKKSNRKQCFGFIDNRPEAIQMRRSQAMVHNDSSQQQQNSQKKQIIQLVLSDEELRGFYNEKLYQGKTLKDILEENEGVFDANEKQQLGLYFSKSDEAAAKAIRVDNAIASINESTNMKSWVYEGKKYHLNFTTQTHHVTEESNPKKHYFFEGSGMDIEPKQCTPQERGSNSRESKFIFTDLPEEVQEFVKVHWSQL